MAKQGDKRQKGEGPLFRATATGRRSRPTRPFSVSPSEEGVAGVLLFLCRKHLNWEPNTSVP